MSLGIMEKLTHSTVRIETNLRDGSVATGTGFYMNLLQKEGSCIPAIITNKHVITNANTGKIHVNLATEDGLPDTGKHQQFQFENFEQQCVKHPDSNVDLAAFPVGPLKNQVQEAGGRLFYMPLLTELIPTDEDRKSYSSMEDIVMIGYPNGIWDKKNNLPVIRRGITATHTAVSWNGRSEFLTDIASFPGSSGSPVLLVNIGGYMDNKGNTFIGSNRIRLLGVHYAGTMHTALGQIRTATEPAITKIPNNIGVAINSKEILILEKEVERIFSSKT